MMVPREYCHCGYVQESAVHPSIPGSDETSKQEQSSYSGSHNMVMMPPAKLQRGQHSKLQHCRANKHLDSNFMYRYVIDKNVFNTVSEIEWYTSTLQT